MIQILYLAAAILQMVTANTEKLIVRWPTEVTTFVKSSSVNKTQPSLVFPYSQVTQSLATSGITGSVGPDCCFSFDTPKDGALFEMRVNWPAIYPVDFDLWLACNDLSNKCKEPYICLRTRYHGVPVPGTKVRREVAFNMGNLG